MPIGDNIIAQLGLQDWPEEKRLRLLENLTELVQKRVTLRLMEKLSSKELKEAEKLADKPEELTDLLSRAVPDMAELIAKETETAKNELVLSVNEKS